MKLLLIYCKNFGFTPTIKTVDNAPVKSMPVQYENVQVAFIHVEQEDDEKDNFLQITRKLISE